MFLSLSFVHAFRTKSSDYIDSRLLHKVCANDNTQPGVR